MVANLDGAPAAPDVDDGLTVEQNSVGFVIKAANGNELFLTNERAAALLARLGQEWIPVSGYAEARARFGGEGVKADKHSNAFIYFVDSKTQWFAMPLPPAPGASDD